MKWEFSQLKGVQRVNWGLSACMACRNKVLGDHWQHLDVVHRVERRGGDGPKESNMRQEICKRYLPAFNDSLFVQDCTTWFELCWQLMHLWWNSDHVKHGEHYLSKEIVILSLSSDH
jgi:hypothetical protein